MKYFDKITFIFFFLISLTGILEHILILQLSPQLNLRVFQAFALGLGYDLMNGAIFSLVVLLTPAPILYKKIIFGFLGVVFFAFIFTDYNYVLLFGTHLPFSTYEYINETDAFISSALHAFQDYTFFILFVCPSITLFILLILLKKKKVSWKVELVVNSISLLTLIIFGGLAGSYSNSYVSKNMENPLTSAAIQYIYLTRNREPIKKINFPENSLKIIKNQISGKIPSGEKWKKYPLVRIKDGLGCTKKPFSKLAQNLCNNLKRPNILILMLESFRAAEVGVFGSKLGLTPEFDNWSKKGILFKNFFANGFQTRHGQIATYCSLFPNYGAAVMKRYHKNNFRCLPEILKNIGYKTSWIFGSDSNFDGQSSFLPKIGFDKIIDEFDFPDSANYLGWGMSDKDLFRQLEIILDSEKKPFFSSALTSTNHHPFDVPKEYKLNKGNSVKDRYREAVYYTDAMLGEFLSRISKKQWFENTLIFITSDTSSFQPTENNPSNFEEFVNLRSKVPLLILSGKLINSGKKLDAIVMNEPVSQVDLAPTILDILSQEVIVPWVGRSLLYRADSSYIDIPLRAYTNRPGAYWAVIEKENRFYRENNLIDHIFGVHNVEKHKIMKEIGQSWLDTITWVLQENLIWPE